MAVRLFIGNLPYGASEADLRAHFAAVAEPTHIVMPVDRETGRPRGFAFVEFAERTVAEQVIDKFNAQPFQGRNLAVSEARAREKIARRAFVHLVEGSEARVPAAVALADRAPVAAASAARVQAAVALVVAAVAAASAVQAAAAIARPTSDRPRLQSDCAAVRRPRSRNTSPRVRSRSGPTVESMRLTIWTMAR